MVSRPELRLGNVYSGAVLLPQVTDEQWDVYETVIDGLMHEHIPFVVGGGIAMSAYAGLMRNTKDLDIYVTRRNREEAIRVLTRAGLSDYFDILPYDREWIYRGQKNEVIVDIIWAMANQRAQVDEDWIRRGPTIALRGKSVSLLPPEELLWAKLYVMQRERCDWGDALNLVYTLGPHIEWDWLVGRLEDDVPLLDAMLRVYTWLCPDGAAKLPKWLFEFPAALQSNGQITDRNDVRAKRLDTRPWFGHALKDQGTEAPDRNRR